MTLKNLFKFPTVMVDGENEERKQHSVEVLGNGDLEYDIVYGEAEYPYYDFVGLEDRWLPTKESLEKALNGRFEACGVRFNNVGERLVPWTKKKFKMELQKFIDDLKAEDKEKEEAIVTITAEDLQTLLGNAKKSE